LGEEFRKICECSRTDSWHWRLWSKAAGGLLEADDIGVFRAAPDRRDHPSAGPKDAGNLAGGGSAVNHVHQAERGQHGVKPAGGRRYLLSAALQKCDVAQAR